MSLATRGYGNGTLTGSIAEVSRRGYFFVDQTAALCPDEVFDLISTCRSAAMQVDESHVFAWVYTTPALCEGGTSLAVSSAWEIISGTSVTLGSNSLDTTNELSASFVTAVEVGLSSVKTTITLADDRVLVGVINFKVYEC